MTEGSDTAGLLIDGVLMAGTVTEGSDTAGSDRAGVLMAGTVTEGSDTVGVLIDGRSPRARHGG